MHVMKDSDVADHCCTFALSDESKEFSSSCDHPHSNTCTQCEDLKDVLERISGAAKSIEYENDDQKEDTMYIVSEVRDIQHFQRIFCLCPPPQLERDIEILVFVRALVLLKPYF